MAFSAVTPRISAVGCARRVPGSSAGLTARARSKTRTQARGKALAGARKDGRLPAWLSLPLDPWAPASGDRCARPAFRRHTSAHDTHSSAPTARPGSNAPPVNGDDVRDAVFCRAGKMEVAGYSVRQVDDLCRRIAAELDAGGSAGPLIEKAAFSRRKYRPRYDIDAVDWFLGRFSLAGHFERDDPWGDLPVAQLARRTSEKGAFKLQCDSAWRDFGQVPGTHLSWGKVKGALSELRTADQQTLASERRGWSRTRVSVGGRSFAVKNAYGKDGRRVRFEDTPDEPRPGVAEFYACVSRDLFGHFTRTLDGRTQPWLSVKVAELADETGMPALYLCGRNFNWRAASSIMFPDQRWLRFLVRGLEDQTPL